MLRKNRDELKKKAHTLFALPFFDLLTQAHTIHCETQPLNQIQISVLLNIKTGACSEDCFYCNQSVHYKTGLKLEKLMAYEEVMAKAREAKEAGASRYCLGAAWRSPSAKNLPKVIDMIKGIKSLGLETCVTLGMLKETDVSALEEAGLHYYNHNLDTSREHYSNIVTTHSYDDRLATLALLAKSDINVCCGGILSMGESLKDRVNFLCELASLEKIPTSIPINFLINMPGTPLANQPQLDEFDFVRTIAVARILFPKACVRLSAGRASMNDALHALCFYAGANSIHTGEKLLTSSLPGLSKDQALLARLNLKPMEDVISS